MKVNTDREVPFIPFSSYIHYVPKFYLPSVDKNKQIKGFNSSFAVGNSDKMLYSSCSIDPGIR